MRRTDGAWTWTCHKCGWSLTNTNNVGGICQECGAKGRCQDLGGHSDFDRDAAATTSDSAEPNWRSAERITDMLLLPPPTDDELLLAFVDDCPNMAVSDYRQRCNLPFDRSPQYFHDHFRREWNKRMNSK